MKMRLALSLAAVALVPWQAIAAPWAPLTQVETAALTKELKGGPPGSITIACGSAACSALEKSVAAVFAVIGWHVTQINHGGLGIDGVQGLRVDSCGVAADEVKAAVERTTTRKIVVVHDGDCKEPEIVFVIGAQ